MNEQLMQLYGYLHGMWRYRWSAVFIAWMVAIAGWLAVLSLPDQYSAKAVVYIDTTSVMAPLLKGLAPQADTGDELAVMTRVLLSRENLMKLVNDTDMHLDTNSRLEKEMLVSKLSNDISIQGGRVGNKRSKDNLYEISYTNTSAQLSYMVVSNLLNTMIENALNSTRSDTVTTQKFLDAQISEYEQRLFVSEQKLAEFKKTNIGYMPNEKGGYYARLQRAQDDVDALNVQLKLTKQRVEALRKQLSGENPLISSETYQPAAVAKLKQMEDKRKELLILYTEKHPDVLALDVSIKNLKERVNSTEDVAPAESDSESVEFNPVYQEMKVALNSAKIEVGVLQAQLEDKKQSAEKLKGFIDVIPEVEAKLTRLNRDYDITRTRYLNLVERRESSRLAESASKSGNDITFRVIEQPVVPLSPSGPPRLLFLAGALLVALGAGLAWSFLRFMLAPTYFDVSQLSEKTGLPILGTVSLYLSPQHKSRRRLQLLSFLSVTCFLLVVFSGVMVFHESGASLMHHYLSILATN